MRFILFLMLFTAFMITVNTGVCIDPNGNALRTTIASDQGGGLDPDGASHTPGTSPDAGPRMDPDG